MIFRDWLVDKFKFKFFKDNDNITEVLPSRRRMGRGALRDNTLIRKVGYLEDSGIGLGKASDSGIGLEDYVPEGSRESEVRPDYLSGALNDGGFEFDGDLEARARKMLVGSKNDLEKNINWFMGKSIFGSENIDYSNIDGTLNYLELIAEDENDGINYAISTAITLLTHLKDYNNRQNAQSKKATSKGFTGYLMGKKGVLTQQRLGDIKIAKKKFSAKIGSGKLTEGQKYKLSGKSIGRDERDLFNISYTKSENPRGNKIHIDYNDSESIFGGYGELDRNSFNNMLEWGTGKKVDSFKVISRSINGYIDDQVSTKKAERIEGYARFNAV